MNITLKTLVKGTMAEFRCYRDGDLWYRIKEFDFDFPVPVEETGTGVFPSEIKAITLMRWIRKHRDRIQNGKWC